METLTTALSGAANFISGAEYDAHSLVELNNNEPKGVCYLVTYGPYDMLPSFDPDCLVAISWMKLCNQTVIIEASNEPEMSPDGQLPFLMFSNGFTISSGDGIRDFGNSNEASLKLETGEEQMLQLLTTTIKNAIRACMWFEDPIREKVRRNYTRNAPWPINLYLNWSRESKMREELSSEGSIPLAEIKSECLDALRKLSDLMGPSPYFGGQRPKYVDAVAYGILAVPLVIFPPIHEIRTMIDTCSNIRSFISRFRRTFFPK